MNFSIRTLMLNVTYVAFAIAAWSFDSELLMGLVTLLFIILILRCVACCLLVCENRPYWIGNATFACGILLTSQYLLIFDAVATYEDYRRHASFSYAYIPVIPTPSAFPPASSGSLPPPIASWSSPPAPLPFAPTPVATSRFSFRTPGGYVGVMKSFLVSLVAYLSGTIAGVICMKVCAAPDKLNQQVSS